jgi:hypothetical protein
MATVVTNRALVAAKRKPTTTKVTSNALSTSWCRSLLGTEVDRITVVAAVSPQAGAAVQQAVAHRAQPEEFVGALGAGRRLSEGVSRRLGWRTAPATRAPFSVSD